MQPTVAAHKQHNPADQRPNEGKQIDESSRNNSHSYGLGVDGDTGRVQWCPGNRLRRLLLVIPATMLPMMIIFLLITHLSLAAATRFDDVLPESADDRAIGQEQYLTDDNDYYSHKNDMEALSLIGVNTNPNMERCSAVNTELSEVFDLEERELLKDVRTSFIPSDLILIPPNCNKDDEEDVLNTKSDDISNSILNYHDNDIHWKILEFFRRKRHALLHMNQTTDNTNTFHDSKIHDRVEDKLGDEAQEKSDNAWKSFNLNTANAELEGSQLIATRKAGEAPNPVVFHAFWKNEGTPEKIRSAQAEVMKRYMDTTAKPCDDFYQYACGNWEKLNPIPKDKAAYDTFEMLRESLDTVIRNLLTDTETPPAKVVAASTNNSASTNGTNSTNSTVICKKNLYDHNTPNDVTPVPHTLNDINLASLRERIIQKRSTFNQIIREHSLRRRRRRSIREASSTTAGPATRAPAAPAAAQAPLPSSDATNAELKAKNLYKSCMDSASLQKRGIQPLQDLLKTFGGWPVLNSTWNREDFDWLHLVARLRLYNNDIFIVEWVGPDIKNSDENVIQFDQTSLGLPTRDYFLQKNNRKYLDAYRNYMTTVIQLLGADSEKANRTASEIVEFEIKLANITSCPEERTNVSVLYNRMTVEVLHQFIPQIDWKRYLTTVLERPINNSETIVIFAMNYMQELANLLSTSEPRTIANYILWRFVRHRVNNLDDRFQDAKQKFYYILFGREQSPPRWKNCVNQVNSNMGMAVGAMFVRKYFDENSKKDTLTMTHELQQSFRELLNLTDWIDGPTKHLAELKVNAMSLRIGYPDYILNQNELNDKYKDLKIDPDKYFENTLNVLMHLTRTEQNKLGQVVNKTTWHTAPAVVNAYYSRNKNQIMFPAGILQPPFYHRHFPKSLNYGGIGVVIGHELTHGFDDKGRLFDRDGNLHRWWSDSAIESFHERARCLVHQYGNYTVSEVGIQVDGENTQGENIADNGGIKQAFRAYKKWLRKQTDPKVLENEKLPQLNATHTQLFFLNFAQVWCGAMRPEATKNKLKTAVHSPGKFRVIGTLSNSEDFAREFNCPSGSAMNPSHKCVVW